MKRIHQFERTDRDITNALLSLMKRKGIEKISVQDILNEAMVNRSTFYQHFADKYAVLERLQEKYISGITERIDALASTGSWEFDRINAALCEYLAQNREQMRLILSVRSENLDLEGRMRSLFSDYLRRSGSSMNELERDLLAGMTVGFFTHFLQREMEEQELSRRMMDTWLSMSVFFFRVERAQDARERFLSLVGEMHRELNASDSASEISSR